MAPALSPPCRSRSATPCARGQFVRLSARPSSVPRARRSAPPLNARCVLSLSRRGQPCVPRVRLPVSQVRCPVEHCEVGSCPECVNICKPPVCRPRCGIPQVRDGFCCYIYSPQGTLLGPSPFQAGKCDVTCNAPVCAWKCRKPDLCPRPQCRMVCDSAPGCAGSAGPVPVPRQSELAVLSSQSAPPPLVAVVQQAQTPSTPAAVPTLASGSSAQPVTVPTLASTN